MLTNLRNSLIGLLLGSLVAFFVIPSYQEVIPYDGIQVDESRTSSLGYEKGYLVSLSFRKTACEFNKLTTLVEVDGVLREYSWSDASGSEKGDRVKGHHHIDIIVDIPRTARRDRGAAIILLTDHICSGKDKESLSVVKKALPGILDRGAPNEAITLTKVLARIEI